MSPRLLLLSLTVGAFGCRDAPTTLSGPSPPPDEPAAAPATYDLLHDPLTIFLAERLGRTLPGTEADPTGLGGPLRIEEAVDPADAVVLDAAFHLILDAAAAPPPDSGGQ